MEEAQTKNWYDKSHKLILILPIAIFILSVVYLINFQHKTGDIIYKDVSLTGGTTVTVFDTKANIGAIQKEISREFPDVRVRLLSDFRTGKQEGFLLETQSSSGKIIPALEKVLGYSLTRDNSSVEFSGEELSQGFYAQLKNAIIAAFLLMGWVVFLMFGESRKIKGITLMLTSLGVGIALPQLPMIKFLVVGAVIAGFIFSLFEKNKTKKDYTITSIIAIVSLVILFSYPLFLFLVPIAVALAAFYTLYSVPSIAVIISALADILMTITVVDISGMQVSSAGIIAFLMLIGYSVDTDILLTTRLLKRKETTTNQAVWSSFKTGITMTLTAIASVAVSLFIIYTSSETLRQIFTILLIGLFFDIFNTWITNASIIKWYVERKGVAK